MPRTPSHIEPGAFTHRHSLLGLFTCTTCPSPSFNMPPTHRPQTLKQAKKAYRKSGATVRLSESELAIIERRSVLQERADRIKEREARRKANIKRKEERNERERETRARMGIAEPAKEGIAHVGPSQLSLGGFLRAGEKRKRDTVEEEGCDGSRIISGASRAAKGYWKDQGGDGCCYTPPQRTPWRNPLKVISANLTTRKTPPGDSAEAGASIAKGSDLTGSKSPSQSQNCSHARSPSSRVQQRSPPVIAESMGSKSPGKDLERRNDSHSIMMAPPPLPKPPQLIPLKSFAQPKPLRQLKSADTTIHKSVKVELCQGTSMAPPPQRGASHYRPSDTNYPQKPSITAPQNQPPNTIDECWDDFFVSGTQIARELSPPIIKAISDGSSVTCIVPHASALHPVVPKSETASPNISSIPKRPIPPRPPSQIRKVPLITPNDDTADLLDLLSTQDLDFSGILTQAHPHIFHDDTNDLLAQLSTQDLDFSGELTQAVQQAPSPVSSDFDEDLTEEDLEDVALEFERESSMAKSITTTPHPQWTNPETEDEARDETSQPAKFSSKHSKPSSSANITTLLPLKTQDKIRTQIINKPAKPHPNIPQTQKPSPSPPPTYQPLPQPPPSSSSSSSSYWDNLDENTFASAILSTPNPDADTKIESQPGNSAKAIKAEAKHHLIPHPCSQEAEAEYDIFDLSTQDLRELVS